MSQRQDPRAARLTADAARKKRETEAVQLRNKHREEMMVKRRNLDADIEATPVADVNAAIQEYTQNIWSNDENSQHAGAHGFQKLLLDKNPPIDAIIDAGVVARLITFLQHPNEEIQYKSLWALTNIAAGRHEHAEHLVEQGAAREFVRLMRDPRQKLREQACWALGNIAGDCAELRDEVLSAGAMDAVLEVLQQESVKLTAVKTATWTMSNLCRGKPSPPFEEVRGAIPVAARLIYSLDHEIEVDALWTLVFLSDGADARQEAVARETVCRRLVMLLRTNDLPYLVPAVRTIGNLMSGDDVTTQKVIDNGALTALLPLLSHSRSGVRKEACWSVSNVLAGDANQIQAAIDAGLIPPILHLLNEDRMDIRREAAWCLANAVSGANSRQIVTFVMELDVLPSLCNLVIQEDERLVDMTLDAIERVLQVGAKMKNEQGNVFAIKIEDAGGAENLERLQEHENTKIFKRAKRILDTYYPEDIEPQQDGQQTGQYDWGQAPSAEPADYSGF